MTSVIISFVFGWKLSLVVVSYIPIVVITNIIIGRVSLPRHPINSKIAQSKLTYLQFLSIKFQTSLSVKEKNAYSAAANVAEEVLSGIRTVFAFGGEKVEIDRYNDRLLNAKRAIRLKGLLTGLSDGILRFLFFGAYALGYWYGIKLVLDDRDKEDKEYTPAVLMIVRQYIFI